ncbi:MAG TPA: hypothetical protein VHJ69_11815 [Gemmatimonadales bacterium]|jgi:hypothetical protein|nr:hypothetical protein [Gemmatimonadales bacterium]
MPARIAQALLDAAMLEHQTKSYAALARAIGQVDVRSARGSDGRVYQIEIEGEWDDQPGGAVRVVGCIDDGSFRDFLPISAEFIVAPDGSLFRPAR